MKEIVLVFSTTTRWSSGFLRWAQRSRFSHVEVAFADYIIGARSSQGVQKYTDTSFMTDRVAKTIEVTDEQYQKFYDFMHEKIGDKYDWRSYIGFAAFKRIHNPNKWVCSELVCEAFYHSGIDVIRDVPSYWTEPRDIWISPALSSEKEAPVYK